MLRALGGRRRRRVTTVDGVRARGVRALRCSLFGLAVTAAPTAALADVACTTPPPTQQVVERTFISSQGRELWFRFAIPAGSDLTRPLGIAMSFHGNVPDPTDSYVPEIAGLREHAEPRGLVTVVARSPDVTQDGNYSRVWIEADHSVIREFLESDLGGCVPLDRDQVYLIGYSQGTCFLSRALVDWLPQGFRGGVSGLCGCWYLENEWMDPAATRDRFKVFVQATRSDFLHSWSVGAYHTLRYNLGLNVRAELDKPGEHCTEFAIDLGQQLDFMRGVRDLPQEPKTERYWEAVDFPTPVWVAAGAAGQRVVVAGLQPNYPDAERKHIRDQQRLLPEAEFASWLDTNYPDYNSQIATFFRYSEDGGDSWTTVGSVPEDVFDIEGHPDGSLYYASTLGIFRADIANGSLKPVSLLPGAGVALEIDDDGNIYAYEQTLHGVTRSTDGGATWQSLSVPFDGLVLDETLSFSRLLSWSPEALIVMRTGSRVMISTDQGTNWTTRDLPPNSDRLAHHGRTLYAGTSLSSDLSVSKDLAMTWTKLVTPQPIAGLETTPDGDVLLRSSGELVYRSSDFGTSWQLEPGLQNIVQYSVAWSAAKGAIAATPRGTLRLITPSSTPGGGGTGGASGSAGTSGANGGAGGSTAVNAGSGQDGGASNDGDDGCGCKLSRGGRSSALGALLTGVFVALLSVRREQRGRARPSATSIAG